MNVIIKVVRSWVDYQIWYLLQLSDYIKQNGDNGSTVKLSFRSMKEMLE